MTVVANLHKNKNLLNSLPRRVEIVNIPIQREIHLLNDIKALVLLIIFFYKRHFSLVHSISPKAGLLAMISSWLVRVPIRLHTFTGQVWATKHGMGRFLLRSLDRIIVSLATIILVDSHSQRKFLSENNVVSASNSIVFGKGSISGVNGKRFKVDPIAREKVRRNMGVDQSNVVILFLGRLKREKGIFELVKAFSEVHSENRNTILWCVGPDEDNLQQEFKLVNGVFLCPFTRVPEQYMAAADIFCMPSYREGFGTAVIEAAACGIPSIGSNIYGLCDAIVNGSTGILVPAKSHLELKIAIKQLAQDKKLRHKMGEAAHIWVLNNFQQSYFTEQIVKLYKKLLNNIS